MKYLGYTICAAWDHCVKLLCLFVKLDAELYPLPLHGQSQAGHVSFSFCSQRKKEGHMALEQLQG